MENKVKTISAKEKLAVKTKVAAYARVSSGKDAMLHSLSAQISYYNRMIQSHKDWLLVGVFADEALTGTKDTRAEFQRMIKDALEGKIDLIVTKSISRFARNTLTLLETTRTLTKKGIAVYFEEEHLYSNSKEGEMILTMLASVAQEQSRSTSENMLWRIKKDMEEGILYGGKPCLGYKIVDKKFIIVPKEAEIVKKIYQLYLEGNGDMKIARILNSLKIKTKNGGNWKMQTISCILKNHNYTGDLLLQKTFTESYLTKKRHLNRGEKTQYLVENDHEPIISKEIFDKVQQERRKRAEKIKVKSHKNIHPFVGMLYCGHCKKHYKYKKNKYRAYWICATYEEQGKDYCSSKQIRDDVLREATCKALAIDKFDVNILNSKIEKIELFSLDRKLVFFFKDKTTIEINYPERSRSLGWTEEKRQLARQRKLAQNKKVVE